MLFKIVDFLIFLFSILLIILFGWAQLTFSKNVRQRFPILTYLDGKKHFILIICSILCLLSVVFYFYLHFLYGSNKPLVPCCQESSSNNSTYSGVGLTSEGVIDIFAANDNIIQPLGDSIPLWFHVTKKGLLVSAVIKDLDQKIVAEIHDNKLYNPSNYYNILCDKSALEVIDNYGLSVLQIEYINYHSFRIGGVFWKEKLPSNLSYPNFPKTNFSKYPIGTTTDVVAIVIGRHGLVTPGKDTDKNVFIKLVKLKIPPLFDTFLEKGTPKRAKLPPRQEMDFKDLF